MAGTTVETAQGRLQGALRDEVVTFRGIPYAAPPLGRNRFRAPQPAAGWTGVREAVRFGPSAPQFSVDIDPIPPICVGETSEDCLYLNVWTPALDGAKRPVVVWIHGGGFTSGSGSQDWWDPCGRSLITRGDVVFVTINYRLGALGYLHLGELCGADLGFTANAAVLDQIAALEWVRDNIAAFGGDPGNVTIWGASAGGMSVGTLMGTPGAKGLFHKAIPQSGAAHNVMSADDATRVAAIFLEGAEVAPEAGERLWDLDLEKILSGQILTQMRFITPNGLLPRSAYGAGMFPFQPCVDGSVIPERPLEAIRRGLAAQVSTLIGTTRDEMRVMSLPNHWNLPVIDAEGLLVRCGEIVPEGAAERVVKAYQEARHGDGAVPIDVFYAIDTDRFMRIPAIRLAEAQALHQPDRTHVYLYTWECLLPGMKAVHGSDTPFFIACWNVPGWDRFTGSGPQADVLTEQIQDMLAAFAHTGDPGHPGLPDWPAYDEARRATMILGPECRAEDAPMDDERRAWDGLL